jgi:replicative DNA helicase
MSKTDAPLERSVIGCLLKSGIENYFSVSEMLDANTFSSPSCGAAFGILSEMYEDGVEKIDLPTLLSTARSKNLDGILTEQEVLKLQSDACGSKNLARNVKKIRKLQILRLINDQLKGKVGEVAAMSGEEDINEILAVTEIDYSSLMASHNEIKNITKNARELLEECAANPVDQIGISTGFKNYDAAIGGGLRGGSLNIIGARMKQGKSTVSNNMGINIAKQGLPVLYVDTEMRTEEQIFRSVASMSGVKIHELETGKFGQKNASVLKVERALDEFESFDYYHVPAAGMEFEQILGMMVRWIRQTVGQDLEGNWNKCVIIYDYIKMTSDKGINANLAEHQALGFMATSLHNLSVRYDLPVISLVQLNRDGIDKGGTGVVAGSDRILRLCTSFAILKPKSIEEIQMDGEENGNKKLVVELARHGPGMADDNYINIAMWGEISKVMELSTAHEVASARHQETGPVGQQQN